jgi:NADP-dependent 3-hydroxy acid dehydrogenase YdfG
MPGIKDKVVVITGASSESIRERAAESARPRKTIVTWLIT